MPISPESPTWLAGVGVADLTPPAGEPIVCFPREPDRQPRIAVGAHDPLLATVLAISAGDSHLVLCAADLCMIRADQLATVRHLVAAELPELPPERIVIAASHTHHSIENSYLFGGQPGDATCGRLVQQLSAAIIAAWRDREPVHLAIGRGPADLSHNRRVIDVQGRSIMQFERQPGVTTGPTDPDVTVIRCTRPNGSPKAIAFHFTAHALAIGPKNDQFTADYPGVARACLARQFPGVAALFLNGAAGDVHPCHSMRPDFAAVDRIGTELGQAVIATLPGLIAMPTPDLRVAQRTLSFPNRLDGTRTVQVDLTVVRLGEWCLAVVPGEVFVAFQLGFRDRLRPRPATLIGYANGWPGYIPTRDAYPIGGYGVDACTTDPTDYGRTILPEGAGETILDALVTLAHELP